MEMTRRQFLKGLVQVAVVVTSVCLVPDCLPLANPHEPQPIRIQKWRIYGATHTSLLQDGDTIWMNETTGERMKITRITGEILEVERNVGWLDWQDQISVSNKLGVNKAWVHEDKLNSYA